MLTDVIITVSGTQIADGENENTEFITNGKYEFNDNFAKICYTESEITGMEGTETEIEVLDKAVKVTRKGSNNHTLLYENGKKNIGYYKTLYGDFSIAVMTNHMDLKLGKNGGEIVVEFVMELNESMQSLNTLHILIRQAERTGLYEQ